MLDQQGKMREAYVFSYIISIPWYSSNTSAEGDLQSRLRTRGRTMRFLFEMWRFSRFQGLWLRSAAEGRRSKPQNLKTLNPPHFKQKSHCPSGTQYAR